MVYIDLIFRVEDYINRLLSDTKYKEYEFIFCYKTKHEEELENGFSYEFLKFKSGTESLSTKENVDKFWEVINEIEKKRKIKDVYEKMLNRLKKVSPKLFTEKENNLLVIGGVNEYIIWIAVAVLVFSYFFVK